MSDPAFEHWWKTECGGTRGGAAAKVKKLCEIAWSNGAYMATLKKKAAGANFTAIMPGSPGLYEFLCGENDDVPERCAIIDHGFGAWLVVHSDLGETPVKHFHDGLTNIRWRKIS